MHPQYVARQSSSNGGSVAAESQAWMSISGSYLLSRRSCSFPQGYIQVAYPQNARGNRRNVGPTRVENRDRRQGNRLNIGCYRFYIGFRQRNLGSQQALACLSLASKRCLTGLHRFYRGNSEGNVHCFYYFITVFCPPPSLPRHPRPFQ